MSYSKWERGQAWQRPQTRRWRFHTPLPDFLTADAFACFDCPIDHDPTGPPPGPLPIGEELPPVIVA